MDSSNLRAANITEFKTLPPPPPSHTHTGEQGADACAGVHAGLRQAPLWAHPLHLVPQGAGPVWLWAQPGRGGSPGGEVGGAMGSLGVWVQSGMATLWTRPSPQSDYCLGRKYDDILLL